jgi:hypothetical protein
MRQCKTDLDLANSLGIRNLNLYEIKIEYKSIIIRYLLNNPVNYMNKIMNNDN